MFGYMVRVRIRVSGRVRVSLRFRDGVRVSVSVRVTLGFRDTVRVSFMV